MHWTSHRHWISGLLPQRACSIRRRRHTAPPSARLLRKGLVAADPVLLSVWVDDKLVGTVHNKEFAVLRVLLESEGPVKRERLMKDLGYRAEQDAIAGFLADRCQVSPGLKVKAAALYREYQAWSGDQVTTSQAFGRRMSERGFEKKREVAGNYYLGLGLLAE